MPANSGHNQQTQWENTYAKHPDFFGAEPSEFGVRAAATFAQHGLRTNLELGCGQGRDTFLLLQQGFDVTALDYSEAGLQQLEQRAKALGVGSRLALRVNDARQAQEPHGAMPETHEGSVRVPSVWDGHPPVNC